MKELLMLLRSWSTLCVAISKCIVSWFYFFYLNFLQLIQSACVQVNFSWHFRSSTKEAVILLCSCSTLYIAFSECRVSRFKLFYFYLSLFTQSVCIKDIYSWNFRYSTKEAVILLSSCSSLYITFSKHVVSWF